MRVEHQKTIFEDGLRYVLAFGIGLGVATVVYDVPDLKANTEFLKKVTHGDYPGVALTAGPDCKPLQLQNPGDEVVKDVVK
jgi:hypothetical protein